MRILMPILNLRLLTMGHVAQIGWPVALSTTRQPDLSLRYSTLAVPLRLTTRQPDLSPAQSTIRRQLTAGTTPHATWSRRTINRLIPARPGCEVVLVAALAPTPRTRLILRTRAATLRATAAPRATTACRTARCAVRRGAGD